ncbi:MAG: heparinase II/III family protein [Pseudomonadota bacterium]
MSSASTVLTGLASLSSKQLVNRLVRATSPQIPSLTMARCSGLGLPLAAITKGDASRAPGLYRGIFELAGCRAVLAGTSIFELPDARPPAFDNALNEFGWLHDLHAADTQLYRIFARGIVAEWLELKVYKSASARRPQTLATRLINWIQCAPFLLKGASRGFETAFMNSLTRQTRLLARRGVNHFIPTNRLMSAIAMVYATYGTTGLESLQKTALCRLSHELDQQILADGGHVSRNGQTLLDLLVLLVPLREALNKALIEIPEPVNAALERMLPMLRFLSHNDGGLAVFNGVSKTSAGRIRAVLEQDQVHGRPLNSAPLTGYSRMAQGRASIIMDTGMPAAPGRNPNATCSPLAFELCDGPHRIVVNCGSRQGADAQWQAASRCTSAHSTMTLAGQDTSTVIDNFFTRHLFDTPALITSGHAEAEVRSEDHGSIISARHTAYVRSFGLAHERRLFLNADGRDLRGEDRFVPEGPLPDAALDPAFAIRFHLHPSVKATLSRDGACVMLLLPNKVGWRFSARGGRLSLESSIYLPDSKSARPTQQIVISGVAGRPDRVLWAFKRLKTAPKPRPSEAQCEPELPLSSG